MPLYEYVCSQCGCRIEVIQKVNDPPPKKCKSCGGNLKKIISPSALQFKGNGWYITDYARKPSSQKEEKPKDKAKADESSSPRSSAAKKPTAPTKE